MKSTKRSGKAQKETKYLDGRLVPESEGMPKKITTSRKHTAVQKDLTAEKQDKSSTIQDKSGKYATEKPLEHCSLLNNYVTDGDSTVLDCPRIPDEEPLPIK